MRLGRGEGISWKVYRLKRGSVVCCLGVTANLVSSSVAIGKAVASDEWRVARGHGNKEAGSQGECKRQGLREKF